MDDLQEVLMYLLGRLADARVFEKCFSADMSEIKLYRENILPYNEMGTDNKIVKE
jgi:hypothetical protein